MLNTEQRHMLKMDCLCVTAIDIGTTHSSCAYSFTHRPEDIKSFIQWKGSDYFQLKVPTVVLFNKKKEFHSFGFEAVNHFNDLRNDEEKKRWYFFEGFHRITEDYTPTVPELSDKSGKRLETYKVYGSIFKFFIERMCQLFCEQTPYVRQSDMRVVFTVPPIFTKSYETMLLKAFYYAGLTERYSFVRETEAMLSYWKNIWCKEAKHLENLNLENKDGFLLVNLRGRTATITALAVHDGIIHRLHNLTGGGWGGQAVNEEFKQLLIKIVGAPVFLEFVEIERGWTDVDEIIDMKKIDLLGKHGAYVTFTLTRLPELYMESCGESIQAAVESSTYSDTIRFHGYKMRMNTDVFKQLFTNTIQKVISNIKDTLDIEAVKGTKTIVMVGGFSDSPLVQDAVKQAFPDCHTFVPKEPAFTIIKGAVMKGHHTKPAKATATIVSKFTYGVHMCHINDENGCSEVEREDTKICMRKGDTVNDGDNFTWALTLDGYDMQHVEIEFFRSLRNETISVDEDDIKILRKVRIDFDGVYKMNIQIQMHLDEYGLASTVRVPEQSVIIKE